MRWYLQADLRPTLTLAATVMPQKVPRRSWLCRDSVGDYGFNALVRSTSGPSRPELRISRSVDVSRLCVGPRQTSKKRYADWAVPTIETPTRSACRARMDMRSDGSIAFIQQFGGIYRVVLRLFPTLAIPNVLPGQPQHIPCIKVMSSLCDGKIRALVNFSKCV